MVIIPSLRVWKTALFMSVWDKQLADSICWPLANLGPESHKCLVELGAYYAL